MLKQSENKYSREEKKNDLTICMLEIAQTILFFMKMKKTKQQPNTAKNMQKIREEKKTRNNT